MDSTTDHDSPSYEMVAFYVEIRGLVVLFLLFVSLFVSAHLVLRRICATPLSDVKLNRTDRAVHQIVLGVCTFTLTVSFAGYFLLPFSIVANKILLDLKHSYYFQWLEPRLVIDLTLVINWGMKSVCILLPFSFFLLTSTGLRLSDGSFASRFFEASLNVIILHILICGTLWSAISSATLFRHLFLRSCGPFTLADPVSILLDFASNNPWLQFFLTALPKAVLWCLQSVHMLLSLGGLLLLFACTPLGLLKLVISLLTSIVKRLSEARSNKRMLFNLTEVYFDALQVKDSVQSVSCFSGPTARWFDTLSLCSFTELTSARNRPWEEKFLQLSKTRLPELRRQFGRLQLEVSPGLSQSLRSFVQPLLPYLILCFLFCMFHITQSLVFYNIITIIQHIVLGLIQPTENQVPGSMCDRSSSGCKNFPTGLMGFKSTSSFGYLGALLQICAVHFILFVGLWGAYSFPALSHLSPRSHNLALEGVLFNVFLVFLFSCGLPIQSNLLGLTALSFPDFFETEYDLRFSDSFREHCLVASGDSFSSAYVPSTSNKKQMEFQNRNWPFAQHTVVYDPPSAATTCLGAPRCNESGCPSAVDNTCPVTQCSARTSPASYPRSTTRLFNVVILIYNLVFLSTSIWIAGRRLGDATLSVSLEVVTSLRRLHFDQEPTPLQP